MRSVQDVNCAGTTRPKFALLYWICRGKHNYRGRTTLVFVAREREYASLVFVLVIVAVARVRRKAVVVARERET